MNLQLEGTSGAHETDFIEFVLNIMLTLEMLSTNKDSYIKKTTTLKHFEQNQTFSISLLCCVLQMFITKKVNVSQ